MSRKKRLQYPGEICRPDERIVEKIGVDLFRPHYVPSVDFEAAEELAKIIRPMKAPPPPRAIPPPPELRATLVQQILNKEYKNFTFVTNPAVPWVDHPLGLRDMGMVADTMSVIALGGGFDYKLNRPSNDPTPAAAGMSETEFEIEEIYVTTPALAGTAIVRVNWNPLLIRLKPA